MTKEIKVTKFSGNVFADIGLPDADDLVAEYEAASRDLTSERSTETMPDPKAEKRCPDDKWEGKAEYLRRSRILNHNDDYLEFLVTRVWKLDRPCRVVDFGCGTGKLGLMLMPLLAPGSTYTGFDQSPALIAEARRVFEGSPFEVELLEGEVHDAPFADDSFDLAVCHGVMMHVPDPMGMLREMIRVTRDGGMVITCEANRNAHNALYYTEELNSQETIPLDLIRTINRQIRLQTGVDHNMGIKAPILMHKAGLKNVQARLSDAVRLVLPPVDDAYKEAVFRAICDEGSGSDPNEQERAEWKAFLVRYGISEEDAEREIERVLAEDFRAKGRDYHTVYPMLMSFSFGTVEKAV